MPFMHSSLHGFTDKFLFYSHFFKRPNGTLTLKANEDKWRERDKKGGSK